MRAAVYAALLLVALPACRFDPDEAAPHLDPPNVVGQCGTTRGVFPKLFEFMQDGKFSGLKTFVDKHLIYSADNPEPDVSLSTLLDALVKLVKGFGLDNTQTAAEIAAKSDALKELEPLVLTLLRFITGEVGGVPHYDAGDAAAHFIRVCEPDHLLTAIQELLTFRSPSHDNELWLNVVAGEIFVLIEDPFFEPFLETFEQNSETGKPAIISLLAQVMGFIRQDNFHISRVETLLESVVYPLVNEDLRNKIITLVDLLGEATDEQAGIFKPLQRAVTCGMEHPPQRDNLLGFAYDFLVSDAVGLRQLLDQVEGLTSVEDAELLLGVAADIIASIRADRETRDDLLDLLAIMLERPDVELVVPTMIDLIEDGVIFELLDAVARLLDGCGRA